MLRKSRGPTQAGLGQQVGVSYRMVAHYERTDAQPPGAILPDLARALVSADDLLGVQPLKEKTSPKAARLLKHLRPVEKLPPADQSAVLKFVDALLETRGIKNGS